MKNFFCIMVTFCFLMVATSAICEESSITPKDQATGEVAKVSADTSQKKELITWMKYDEGMKSAQEKNLPVYVEFYATWCPPCKMMAQTTFQDKEVASLLNDGFVSIKVDIDKEKDLALRYGARSIPHHIVMNSKGEVLKVLRGAMPADMFLANIRDAVK